MKKPTSITIKNSGSFDDELGWKIEGIDEVTIDGFTGKGTKGGPALTIIDVGQADLSKVFTEGTNGQGVRIVGYDIEIPSEIASEISDIRKSSSSLDEFTDKLKRSGAGRWLMNQKGIDWAVLAASIFG
ncbi:hypothetical protein AB3Y40_08490 [Yoonia sp. R2331]|uniref:hypothetical protein n=1 Tax=Yoonia sp. R2331 TaxID=3237238 RepID=UPI0034E49E96